MLFLLVNVNEEIFVMFCLNFHHVIHFVLLQYLPSCQLKTRGGDKLHPEAFIETIPEN